MGEFDRQFIRWYLVPDTINCGRGRRSIIGAGHRPRSETTRDTGDPRDSFS